MHASKWTERTKRKRDVQAAGPRTHGEEECYKRQDNGRTQQLVLSNSHFSLEERGGKAAAASTARASASWKSGRKFRTRVSITVDRNVEV